MNHGNNAGRAKTAHIKFRVRIKTIPKQINAAIAAHFTARKILDGGALTYQRAAKITPIRIAAPRTKYGIMTRTGPSLGGQFGGLNRPLFLPDFPMLGALLRQIRPRLSAIPAVFGR